MELEKGSGGTRGGFGDERIQKWIERSPKGTREVARKGHGSPGQGEALAGQCRAGKDLAGQARGCRSREGEGGSRQARL